MSKQNEEGDECFYESLDRLVSSSCSCSASNSDNDSDSTTYSAADEQHAGDGRRRIRSTIPVPRFPMGASRFDVWISEPESVSERRSRLFRQMGLSRHPTRSRVSPECDELTSEIEVSDTSRSVLSNQIARKDHEESSSSVSGDSRIVIPKSDVATVQTGVGDSDGQYQQRNSSLSSSSSSSSSLLNSLSCSILSIRSRAEIDRISPASVNNFGDNNRKFAPYDDTDDHHSNVVGNGESEAAISALAKNYDAENAEKVGSTAGENVDLSEQVYTIKNLDNGKEFVVNEILEDGTWKKLREVETGRQLTMEEFENFVGHSPIVQELMRRQNVDTARDSKNSNSNETTSGLASKFKKRGSWLKTIKNVASSVTGSKERRSSDDASVDKGGRRSSSATDDSQDISFHGPERVRVKQYGKSCKELTALYKSQEIQAHNGSIWTMKFSLDGKYLASAGEDCVIHIWQVVEAEKEGELALDKAKLLLLANGSSEPTTMSPRRKGRPSVSRKSLSLDNIVVPEFVFGLSETPICSFHGHVDDVLDLSWSKSQHLLSSSMDKTVRLWHLSSQTCLKIFSHSDYVTCIQFNPVDDRYFISGSLDSKFRIWSIADRQVMDWYDMHEMVTAACYTPDGQGALVGSYKGSCRVYNTSDNKRQHKTQINLQNRKKKAHHRKITGLQFVPGSSSEVLVTSADSRIRVVDDVDLVCKFKGFRNTNSQISASLTADGKYVVAASEDSHIYVWKYESVSRPGRSKGVTVANSYEYFHCQDVSAAIPWPGMAAEDGIQDGFGINANIDDIKPNHPPSPVDGPDGKTNREHTGIISSATNGYLLDRISAAWPEEKRSCGRNSSSRVSTDMSDGQQTSHKSPWGLVIVAAGLRGKILTFQNFGLPTRV